jgi:hypothetical protein
MILSKIINLTILLINLSILDLTFFAKLFDQTRFEFNIMLNFIDLALVVLRLLDAVLQLLSVDCEFLGKSLVLDE